MSQAQEVSQDNFEVLLRRQGWHLIRYRPIHTDPNVIRLKQTFTLNASESNDTIFYQAFGDNTFRKLLRHIFFHKQCTYEDLKRICASKQKLDSYLAFMVEQGLIEQANDLWCKGTTYHQIDNLGPTLEWYIAEWFRSWLLVPARHGVAIKGIADGGDLDVVAFVDGIRVMVECKSGSPSQITETEMKLFLRRAADFNPEVAIMLIDTESRIEPQIDMLNRFRMGSDPLTPQDDHKSLYWGARHIYVVNTRVSITESLSAILRLYYSKIRHIAFWRLSH